MIKIKPILLTVIKVIIYFIFFFTQLMILGFAFNYNIFNIFTDGDFSTFKDKNFLGNFEYGEKFYLFIILPFILTFFWIFRKLIKKKIKIGIVIAIIEIILIGCAIVNLMHFHCAEYDFKFSDKIKCYIDLSDEYTYLTEDFKFKYYRCEYKERFATSIEYCKGLSYGVNKIKWDKNILNKNTLIIEALVNMHSCSNYPAGIDIVDENIIKLYVSEPHICSFARDNYKVIFKIKDLQKKDYRIQLNNMPEKIITANGEVRELKNENVDINELPDGNLEADGKDETADWKIYRNKKFGFEMKYPEDFFPEQVLQPKTKIIQCDYANFLNNCSTEVKNINGVPFCLQETGGAGLGTAYTTYNYTTVRDRECFVVFFTVAYPNCFNLLPIENQEIQEAYDKCRMINEVTKPEIIDKILSTFKFIE